MLASFQPEYGAADGAEGGVAFDLALQPGGFRVTGLHFLEGPAAPWSEGRIMRGAVPRSRAVLVMR
ncbi:hypothetical protein [Roseomonas chloroacetimidivorans]|uniref:hypothetical protein n=1 Tax=Roseomonas chloroacetimidivorans TaxID=1766656 RepID=UPI003C75D2D6